MPSGIIFTLYCDITKAVETQNINDTLNYSAVQKLIQKFLEIHNEYILLEKLTDDVATILLGTFDALEKIECTCWKPLALRGAKNVGISIVKER